MTPFDEQYAQDQTIPRYKNLEHMLGTGRPGLVLEGLTHLGKVQVVEPYAAADAHVLVDKPHRRDGGQCGRMKPGDLYVFCTEYVHELSRIARDTWRVVLAVFCVISSDREELVVWS